MGLNNPLVEERMNSLFGKQHADHLRAQLRTTPRTEREPAIVEKLVQALKGMGGKYILPFRFRNESGTRTSHHLIFVSKSFKGYEIMKEIMGKESSKADQGVPSFEYNPVDKRFQALFEFTRPLEDLEEMLLAVFAGRTMTMVEIYQEHSVGRPYLKKNYKDALKKLESEKKIETQPSRGQRKKGTFGDKVWVTFSAGGG